MVSAEQQSQIFGPKRLICKECAIPLPKANFTKGSSVCKHCTPKVIRRKELVITPEEHYKNEFTDQLRELRRTSEPQIVNGIQKAIDLLGETPQEIAAKCLKEMRDPGAAFTDMSDEAKAALPKDYKTMGAFIRMLQDAQVIHDKDLDSHNPFDGMSAEELRATMLKGAIDHAERDKELRVQLIKAFVDRCPTFFDEVAQVAKDMMPAEVVEV